MPIIIQFTIKQALETTNYINGIYTTIGDACVCVCKI